MWNIWRAECRTGKVSSNLRNGCTTADNRFTSSLQSSSSTRGWVVPAHIGLLLGDDHLVLTGEFIHIDLTALVLVLSNSLSDMSWKGSAFSSEHGGVSGMISPLLRSFHAAANG